MNELVSRLRERGRVVAALGLVVALGLLVYAGFHYLERGRSVARVDGTYIYQSEYEDKLTQRLDFLEGRGQESADEAIERDVIGNMIDATLIENYADRNGIIVEESDIDRQVQSSIESLGEEEFRKRLDDLYAEDADERYRQVVRADLIREKVEQDLEQPLSEWLSEQREQASISRYR